MSKYVCSALLALAFGMVSVTWSYLTSMKSQADLLVNWSLGNEAGSGTPPITRLESSPAMALVIRHRLLLMAMLLLAVICCSLQRRQISELATGRQTAHEDPTAATSTATIPTKLNISTQTPSSISTARISRNISSTSISARVPNTTPPSTLLAQLLSKWSSESALPKVLEAQLQCSDAICSDFALRNLKCMDRTRNIVKRMAAPTCRFQKGESKPKYLLTSYPGSGNTWVRQVLEKATGICTGSIYCGRGIMLSGMIGEGVNSSSVLVVKTHKTKTRGDATIFIVRNPIDAIVSFWKLYLVNKKMYKTEENVHVANPPVEYFRSHSEWNNWVTGQVNHWTDLIKGELSITNKPLLIVTYEDIKSNTTREVFRMLDFLHVKYSAEEIVEKFKDDQLTLFKRPKAKDFDPYTSPQRDIVRTRLKQLSTSLHHKTMVEIIERYLLEL